VHVEAHFQERSLHPLCLSLALLAEGREGWGESLGCPLPSAERGPLESGSARERRNHTSRLLRPWSITHNCSHNKHI
jgi:hypothetical protein